MDKKMTSGEIAKKVGVSQKAIRLYDEKGLLKPSDYSEGNSISRASETDCYGER